MTAPGTYRSFPRGVFSGWFFAIPDNLKSFDWQTKSRKRLPGGISTTLPSLRLRDFVLTLVTCGLWLVVVTLRHRRF